MMFSVPVSAGLFPQEMGVGVRPCSTGWHGADGRTLRPVRRHDLLQEHLGVLEEGAREHGCAHLHRGAAGDRPACTRRPSTVATPISTRRLIVSVLLLIGRYLDHKCAPDAHPRMRPRPFVDAGVHGDPLRWARTWVNPWPCATSPSATGWSSCRATGCRSTLRSRARRHRTGRQPAHR